MKRESINTKKVGRKVGISAAVRSVVVGFLVRKSPENFEHTTFHKPSNNC